MFQCLRGLICQSHHTIIRDSNLSFGERELSVSATNSGLRFDVEAGFSSADEGIHAAGNAEPAAKANTICVATWACTVCQVVVVSPPSLP